MPKRRCPTTMNKEMVRIPSSSRHIEHLLCPSKFLLLSASSVWDFSFSSRPSKEANFHQRFRLPNDLNRKIRTIPTGIKLLTEALNSKCAFRHIWPDNIINALK
uniref:Uncharacterized protein n=1 Tax=Opuntia streptacantha TaxID=393608 RepID=A0A7C9A9P6_OPUST